MAFNMNRNQIIAIAIPPILVAIMHPIFQSLVGVLSNDRIAWYIGLIIYWLIWGAAFPLVIAGKDRLKKLIRPHKPTLKILLIIFIPLGGALATRLFVPGMGYEKESVWILLLLLSTSFGNGFFEEVLWRGVYVKLFPNNMFFWLIWPNIWFALWHYVPGSVFHDNVIGLIGLVAGSALMGFILSYLTKNTGTLWWAIIAHVLGGIIMVV